MISSDPGIYVKQDMQPQTPDPQEPDLPAAIIGPVVSIVEDVEAAEIDDDFIDNMSSANVTIPYVDRNDSDNDVNNVEIKLQRPSGHSKVIYDADDQPTWVTIDESSVELDFTTSTEGETFLKDVNDEWGGTEDFDAIKGSQIILSFTENRDDLVGNVLLAQGETDINQKLGQADLKNPMGIMGDIVSSVAPNTGTYFVPTKNYIGNALEVFNGGDPVEGTLPDEGEEVNKALALLEPLRVNNIAILSEDPLTHQTGINHVNEMSDMEEGQYRKIWTYKPCPTVTEVVEASTEYSNEDEVSLIDLKRKQVDLLSSYAQSLADKRARVLYNDFAAEVNGEEVELPGYFLAGMYAAVKSSIEPEQGLTRYSIGGVVNELYNANKWFKPSQLKTLSENGVWACVQNNRNEPIKCRFQTTTNTLNNKTRQESLIATIDYISYFYKDTLDPLLGINNVTPEVKKNVRKTIGLMNSQLKSEGKLIKGKILEFYEDPNNSSRIKVRVEFKIPTPLDQILVIMEF